jgi:hypothetical protein
MKKGINVDLTQWNWCNERVVDLDAISRNAAQIVLGELDKDGDIYCSLDDGQLVVNFSACDGEIHFESLLSDTLESLDAEERTEVAKILRTIASGLEE